MKDGRPLVLVLNGPNLARLGKRDSLVYGVGTYSELETICQEVGAEFGMAVDVRQTVLRIAHRRSLDLTDLFFQFADCFGAGFAGRLPLRDLTGQPRRNRVADLMVLLRSVSLEEVVVRKRLQSRGFANGEAAALRGIRVDEESPQSRRRISSRLTSLPASPARRQRTLAACG